ncbi:glycosyltransferase 87 family protein [Streptomyces sioyaensis]|uniref:glycosyltransferase 87 family protein n=1 Tax=Streptomyces sioyaensis TaxID=67364 RepID=UPI00340F9BFF
MSAADGSGTGRRTWAQSIARPRRLLLAAALLMVSVAGFWALYQVQQMPMSDIVVYRAEGEAAAAGGDLYGFTVSRWDLPATYPPFAAVLFIPTTWLSLGVLKILGVLANAALLALLGHLSAKAAGLHKAAHSAPFLLAVTALGLWLEPVFQTFVFGQVNLALACLVLWDLSRPDGARLKGFATGIAAGIKLTPALLAVYLLVTGRVKAACTTLAGFLCSVLLGWLALPDASVEYWTRRVFETGRVGKAWIVDNQSLQGLITRVLHDPDPGLLWAVPALLTAAAGLYAARRVYVRRGLDHWGVLCTAVTALLVSPISWSHHWVWCVPLLITLAAQTRRIPWRRALLAAVTLVFAARTMWITPHAGALDLHLPWWQQPFAAPYPVLGLALLAAVIWWTRRSAGVPAALHGGRLPAPRAAQELSGRSPAG